MVDHNLEVLRDDLGVRVEYFDVVEVQLTTGERRVYVVDWSRETGPYVWIALDKVWNLKGAHFLRVIGRVHPKGGNCNGR